MKNRNNILLIVIIVFLLQAKLFSQDSLKSKKLFFPQVIEINSGYGIIAKHRPIVDYFITGHVPSVNVNFGRIMSGKQEWQRKYNYPELGVGFYYANFNNKYLGESYTFYAYTKLPFTKYEKPVFGYFDLGLGVSYITKPFNIENNYYNIIIGSHLNAYLRIGVLAEIKIAKNISLVSGLSLNHSSNSKVKTPNLGVNVLSYNLGFKYFLVKNEFEKHNEIDDYKKNNSYFLTFSMGAKSVSKPENPIYLASSLVFDYNRNISFKSAFGAGIDVFFDKSLEYYYIQSSIPYKKIINDFQVGAHGAYVLKFNKVWFNFNLGYYIIDNLNLQGKIYSRIATRASIYKNIYLSIGMKTHFAKADLLEIGLGYKLK